MDVIELILSHVEMDSESFVRMGMVCKAWRYVCRSSPTLVVNVAARSNIQTVLVCERLFALSMDEAKRFAMVRGVSRGFCESELFFESILTSTGSVVGWRNRLAKTRACGIPVPTQERGNEKQTQSQKTGLQPALQ